MAKILIVAGHGEGDPGAVASGVRESDLTRELARLTEKKLAGQAELFDTSLNMYKFLKNGGSFDFSKYDYILELHFNAGAAKTANSATTGSEILINSGRDASAEELALLQKLADLGFRNRGVKKRSDLQNMNIMKKKGIPYSLLEVCFIDDPDDMQLYEAKKEAVAEAVANALGGTARELEGVNDLVWELASRNILTDKALWLKKLEEDKNAYWLARKTVKYLQEKQV